MVRLLGSLGCALLASPAFAQAAREFHGKAGWFNRAGVFPSIERSEFPVSAEAERAIAVIKRTMEGAAEPAVALTVPLVVEARAAGNWDEAH